MSTNDRANPRHKRAQPGRVAVGRTVEMVTYLPAIHGVTPARHFVTAWMAALGERAALMVEDSRLTECAVAHADYLASRVDTEPSMHIGLNNSTPDQRVRDSGYAIPSHWHSNHVESCATHTGGPLAALTMLMDSPGHYNHMMGVGGFEGHVVYGVGAQRTYIVVLACPEEMG